MRLGSLCAAPGFDGSLGPPVVTVAGFTVTALLGPIVYGSGAVLLIAALVRQRHVILVLGILGGVAGSIAVFELTVGGDSVPIERRLGIFAVIVMAVIVVSALLPTVSRTNTSIRRSHISHHGRFGRYKSIPSNIYPISER